MIDETMMTANELASKMKVTKASISNWVKRGCPTVTRRPLRFDWEDVKDWLNNRTKEN